MTMLDKDAAIKLMLRRLGVTEEASLSTYAKGRMQRELLPLLASPLIRADDPYAYTVAESIVVADKCLSFAKGLDDATMDIRAAATEVLATARTMLATVQEHETRLKSMEATLDRRQQEIDARLDRIERLLMTQPKPVPAQPQPKPAQAPRQQRPTAPAQPKPAVPAPYPHQSMWTRFKKWFWSN